MFPTVHGLQKALVQSASPGESALLPPRSHGAASPSRVHRVFPLSFAGKVHKPVFPWQAAGALILLQTFVTEKAPQFQIW